MRRLTLLLMVFGLVAFSSPASSQDLSQAAQREYIGDILQIDSRTALTGTWTCTTSSLTCTGVAGGATEAAQDELADEDIVELCGYRYVVDGEPASQSSITITPHRVGSTGELRTGADAACTGQTAYLVNLGASATAYTVDDGSGTATALSLSTSTVGAAALEVGGAYAGGSGCTFSAAGVLQCNGAATIDGAVAANGGFSVDTPAFVVADTTGALTTTGAIAANGGFSVDSPAFVIADTTGAITTTGAAALNGGISVDSPAFTVTDTTGAVSTASTISSGGLNTISIDSNAAADTEFLLFKDTDQAAKTTGTTSNAISWDWYADTSTPASWVLKEAGRIELYSIGDWEDDAGAFAAAGSGWKFHAASSGSLVTPLTLGPVNNALKVGLNSWGIQTTNGYLSSFFWTASYAAISGNYSDASVAGAGVSFGANGRSYEGSTNDTDDYTILIPPGYSDGGAGNQGGANDITTYEVVSSVSTAVTPGTGVATIGLTQYANTSSVALVVDYGDVTDTDGDKIITLGTLPARSLVQYASIENTTPAAGTGCSNVYVSIGTTGDSDVDTLILDQDSQAGSAAAFWGDADGERGADLPDADSMGAKLYSASATQAIDFQAESVGCNLNALTAGSWKATLTYTVLP